MSQQTGITVQPTTSKDALAILGASDDRELLSQGLDDFLPYDIEYTITVDILEVKAKKNHDNRGVFVHLRVVESSDPQNVKPGKQYVLAFFDQHKTMPEFVISKMLQSRREFAAAIAGQKLDESFSAAPVLLQLHNEVEPLHVKMTFTNKYQRSTRQGKKIHELSYALAK